MSTAHGVVLVVLTALGAGVGALTARQLATGGYRLESDGPWVRPRLWWLPVPAVALVWAWLAWHIGALAHWGALPAYLLFGWLAVALIWVDLDVHRLPDGLVLPAYPALAVLLVVATASQGSWKPLLWAGVGTLVLFLLYLLLAVISPGALGFGDVKLAGIIGGVLGWAGPEHLVLGTVAGFLVGGVVAVVLLLARRAGLRSFIAYGPPMLIGALLTLGLPFQIMTAAASG